MKLTKRQRQVADAVISGNPAVQGMSPDEFNRVLDLPAVRDWIRAETERTVFLCMPEAARLLRQTLRGPTPGVKQRFLTAPEQKALEYALRLNGMTGKSSIQDKGSSGVDEFIDPVAHPN